MVVHKLGSSVCLAHMRSAAAQEWASANAMCMHSMDGRPRSGYVAFQEPGVVRRSIIAGHCLHAVVY